MENPKAATIRQAQEAFAAWKSVNDQINALENALQQQVPARDGPLSEPHAQLPALSLEAERLLLMAQHALLTIKTPRSSNGESTWG
jgi:hypothetical protein